MPIRRSDINYLRLLSTSHENLVNLASFTLRSLRENVSHCDAFAICCWSIFACVFWYGMMKFGLVFPNDSPGKPSMSPSDIRRHRKHQQRIAKCLAKRGIKGFYKLPPELVDLIVDADCQNANNMYDLTGSSLPAMAITCRAFLPRVRYYLHSRYGLSWSMWNTSSVVRCYLLSPDIASSVVSLDLSIYRGSDDPSWPTHSQVLATLQRFTGILRLVLSGLQSEDPLLARVRGIFINNFALVRNLELSLCSFEDIHEFSAFVHSFPQLEKFKYSSVSSQQWICPCSNHPGRSKDIISHHRTISHPPQSLYDLDVSQHSDHPCNIADIAYWFAMLPGVSSKLSKLVYWPCTFKADDYDHSSLFGAAGRALTSLSLRWDERLKSKREIPFSTMLLHENVHLQSLWFNFGRDFMLYTPSEHRSFYHDPRQHDETQWLPGIIGNISSEILNELVIYFEYHLGATEEAFTLAFLHLTDIDEVLAHPRFKPTGLWFIGVVHKVKGEQYTLQEEQEELERSIIALMPKTAQRSRLTITLHTYAF